MKKPRRRRLPASFWPMQAGPGKTTAAPLWLSLAAAIIAAVVMPHQSPFPYRYENGQIWNYPNLKAPFDFEVLYPEAQVRAQLDRINAEHAPYYILHSEIGRQQRQRFAELFSEQARIGRNDTRYEDMVLNKAVYLNYGQRLLNELYTRGIAGDELAMLKRDDPNAAIVLVNGSGEQRVPSTQFFTRETALDFLTDSLPYSPLRQPELLLPIFEKALAPNVLFSDSLTALGKRRKIAAVVSTGITVRKNEIIVKKGDLISDEIYRKLDSLGGRYDSPKGLRITCGYFVLAWVAFFIFFSWLRKMHATLWDRWGTVIYVPGLVLAFLLAINFLAWIGPAVTLLLPLWGLPRLLGRWAGGDIGWSAWLLLMILSTITVDWSAGWLAIQTVGVAGVQFFQGRFYSWNTRLRATFWIALLQILVWQACILAGKIPPGLQILDALLFLGLANGLLILVLPLSRAMEQALRE